jgi:hypothetical protein
MIDPSRRALASRSLAGCDCPICSRAAALDAMRHVADVRQPAPPAIRKGLAVGLPIAGSAWLALGGAALWLLARLT